MAPKIIRYCEHCGALRRNYGTKLRYCSNACSAAARQREPAERFWALVNQTDSCWLWIGAKSPKGYGRFCVRHGYTTEAHRFAWELAHGPIPDSLCVLHNCPNGDDPSCVRPDHMWLGTIAQNNRDMADKGRASRIAKAVGDKNGAHTHPDLVPRGEQHGKAKLTETMVKLIRAEYAAGVSSNELARRLNVTRGAIGHVVKRTNWKHVK